MRQKYLDISADNKLQNISFFTPSEGYVAFQKWIGYTQDSGRTFTRKYIEYGNVDYSNYQVNLTFGFGINGVHAFSKDTIIVYGDYGFVPAILYSVDQGNTFKLVFHSSYINPPGLDEEIRQVTFPFNSKTGYAIDSYRILKTTNGGVNWSVIKTESFSALQFLNNNVGFVTADNKISKTLNAGNTWVPLTVPGGEIRSSFFFTENKGWVNTFDYPNGKIYYTNNGGVSWTLMSDPAYTSIISSEINFTSDSTGYALSTSFDVYKSTDSGKIWERIPRSINFSPSDYWHTDLFFNSSNQFWAGGGHGLLEMTTNGGGQTYPDARFSIDVSSLSSNNTIKLKNLSKKGYQYKWIKNSVVLASTYDASYVSNRLSIDTIKLVVIKDNLYDTTVEVIDTRANQAPCKADFSVQSDTAIAKFAASYNTYAVKHYWNFGDGFIDSINNNPVHVYNRIGDYTVKHIVKNTIDGCQDSTTQTVSIIRLTNCLQVDITYKVDSFYTNLLTFDFVQKPGTELGNRPVSSISWDFGDGTISGNSKHQFDSSKYYTIRLTVKHAFTGCVSTIVKPVFIAMEEGCNAAFSVTNRDPLGFYIDSGALRFYSKPHVQTNAITNHWIFYNKDTVKTANAEYVEKKFFKEGFDENFETSDNTCLSYTLEFDINALTVPVKHIISNNTTGCTDEDSTVFRVPTREQVYIRPVPDPKFPNLVTFNAYRYYKYGQDSIDFHSRWRIDNLYLGGWTGPGSYNTTTHFFPDDRGHIIAVASPSCVGGKREVYYINYAAPPLPPCAIYPPDFDITFDPAQPSLAVFSIPGQIEFVNRELGWKRMFYFGTGDSSSINNTAYNFPGPGTYSVVLKYTSPSGCIKEVVKQITIAATCSVNAKFSATPGAANPLVLNFKNLTTPDTTTISYKWFFGNGDSSVTKNPSYTYPNGGTYKVRLIATRSASCISLYDTSITVNYNCILSAKFTLNRANQTTFAIKFVDQTTPDSSNNKYKWYFGNEDSSTLRNPEYSYSAPGTYKVKLVVTSGLCTSTKDTTIVIESQVVSITSFTPQSGPVGTRVTITGTNFSPSAENNIVYFGAVRAVVSNASTNTISVNVPVGATFQSITVTTNKLTAYSAKPFIVTFGSATSTFTPNSFANKIDSVVGGSPTGISTGDFDMDGKVDMAFSNSYGWLTAFKNISTNGNVTLKEKSGYTASGGLKALAIADFDGDGRLDVVVAVDNDYRGAAIYRNTSANGVISFDAEQKVDLAVLGADHVAVGDLDGDGRVDLALVGFYSNWVSILKNTSVNGAISFDKQINYSTGTGPTGVIIGDLNNDGKPDVAVANSRTSSISIFRNTSAFYKISLAPKIEVAVKSPSPKIAIGDLDGDGKPEIVSANSISSTVSVLRNSSTASAVSFNLKIDYATGAYPTYVSLGDMDGDGKPDIITANNQEASISLLKNKGANGGMSFSPKVDFIARNGATGISVGDFDNDGRPDIAVANSSGTVSILRNKIPASSDSCNIKAKFTYVSSTGIPATISFFNQTIPDSTSVKYKWYFGNGDSSELKNPKYTYNTSGTYQIHLTATSGTCTSSIDTVIIISPPACNLTAKFTRSGSTTAPALISFTNQTTPDSASYKWYFGNGDSSAAKSPSYTYQTAGTYYVSMIAAKGNCTSTFRDTIVISTAPPACNLTAKFTPSGSTTAPALISFTNQTTPDSASFKWYFGNGDSSAIKSPSYTYQTPGTYYVSMIATKGTCISTFRDTVIITAAPVACNIAAKFTRSGSTTAPALISFTNQTTPDSANYKWYFGNGDSSASKSPSYTYQTPGTYYVSMIATKGTCTSTFRDTVIITAAPVACNIAAKFTRSGSTTAPALISFTNQTAPDSASYKWYFGNGDSSVIKNPSHTYQAAGTYYVQLVAARGSCTSIFRDTVIITAAPVACNIAAKFTRSGSTTAPALISFTNQTTPDSASYKWYFGNGDSSAAKSPSFTYQTAGTYNVSMIATKGNCTSTFRDTIIITAAPVACNISAKFTRSGSAIAPALISFTNQTTPDSAGYKWHFGNGDSSAAKSPSYTYQTAGTYYVQLVATKGICTGTFRDTIVITDPLPACSLAAKFTYSKSVANPATVIFQNQTTPDSANITYKWYFGNGDSSTAKNPVYTYPLPGSYLVRLKAGNNVCYVSKDTTIIIPATNACGLLPLFTYTVDSLQANKIAFINKTQSTSGSPKYIWSFGDGLSDTSKNPQHTYWQAGNYNVCLQAIESTSCIKTYCTTVVVTLPAERIHVTPNPVQYTFNLYFNAERSSTYVIRITNFSGNIVKEVKYLAVPGANNVLLHVADLAPGYYILTADNKDEKLQVKFLKL